MKRPLSTMRLLTLVGATFSILALSGFQACEITVVPIDPEPSEPEPGEPEPQPGQECFADSDCPGDLVCEFTGDCLPYPCDDGEVCPEVCAPQGFCVEPRGNTECWDLDLDACQQNADCQIEEVFLPCEQPDVGEDGSAGDAMMPPDCGDTEFICVPVDEPPPPPPPFECDTDQDCGEGAHCEVYEYCYQESDCDPFSGECSGDCEYESICVPDEPPPPFECDTDQDCGPGQRCEFVEYCESTPGCDPAAGEDCALIDPFCGVESFCVPEDEPPFGCDADLDCGEGAHCEAIEYCWDEPVDCTAEDGTDCTMPYPCEVELICVPDEPPFGGDCLDDADCGQGERCELIDSCVDPGPCQPDENGNCIDIGAPCILEGVCVPVEPPPPSECRDDADCGADSHCELYDVCLPNDCNDPTGQDCLDPTPCLVEGVCVPNEPPSECFDDADCGQGERCELIDSCVEPGPCQPDENGNCMDIGAPCILEGVCVPVEPPPPAECRDDADCGEGAICDLVETCYEPPCAAGSQVCEPVCVVEGRCVQPDGTGAP